MRPSPHTWSGKGIEYRYSFNDDFDVIERITRLETAENPVT